MYQKIGHTACADVLIDLAELGKQKLFRPNEVIALWVPCAGVQVATIFLRWL